MKGLAILVFVAFIAPFFPNPVEAGKCYRCGVEGAPSCEEFRKASNCDRKYRKDFTVDLDYDSFLDCSRCMSETKDRELIKLNCARHGERSNNDDGDGRKVEVCDGHFCNAIGFPEKKADAGSCYNCADQSCEDFDKASEEEKKCKFSMNLGSEHDSKLDCSKCVTFTKNDKVVRRSCLPRSLNTDADEVNGEKFFVCEGDFCNEGSGNFRTSRRCYSCSLPPKSCEHFEPDRADSDRNITFIQDAKTPVHPPSDCSKCITMTLKGVVIALGCIALGLDTSKDAVVGKFKSHFCKGDLCNGGDPRNFLDSAGSLRSWAMGTLLTTAASFLKGSLF